MQNCKDAMVRSIIRDGFLIREPRMGTVEVVSGGFGKPKAKMLQNPWLIVPIHVEISKP